MKRLALLVLLAAGCVKAPKTFPCGREACRTGQYCSLVSPLLPPNMTPVTKAACEPLPAACEHDATCECLGRAGVPGTCRVVEGGPRVAYRKPAG
jgi:hypothetical protein